MGLTRHAGTWTIEDRCESVWRYLPVEVPAGTGALRVELDYDTGGGVLDLGCLSPNGFRGWSGGARRFFVITAAAATPGYLAGELEPGTWQIMVGLHQIAAAGTRYELTAEVTSRTTPDGPAGPIGPGEPVPPAALRPPRRELPGEPGLRWLAGDLHAHTVHSDGVLTVPELAAFAAGRGLDFLAVTDHNTISQHAELPAAAAAHGIGLLPGQEVTTERGHANAFGEIGWVDFRRPPDEWLTQTEREGGLLSVNHPYGGHVSWTAPMRRRPPLLEVWHWSWLDPRWTTPLAWWLAWDPAATAVGGSDWHRPGSDAPPGSPVTWVQAASTEPAALIEALRAGRAAVSASRDGPVLLRADGELVACGADGTILTGPDGPVTRVRGDLARFPSVPGHHRLTDPTGATLALTS
ncbi:MAG TPA: CehA/McbA family metallohydrolase [Streptosporangiaceae bacterium]